MEKVYSITTIFFRAFIDRTVCGEKIEELTPTPTVWEQI